MPDKGEIAKTRRLILREMTLKDLDGLYDIYNSWGMIEGVQPLSPDRDEEYAKLAGYIEWMYGFYGVGLWAVCLKDDGRMIGRCGAWPSEILGDWLLELGYMIHKDWCGHGYGLEAMEAVVDYIRSDTEFEKAAAQIHKNNTASIRLARRLGMTEDAEGFKQEDQMCLYRLDIM